jgi:hypothetical protein
VEAELDDIWLYIARKNGSIDIATHDRSSVDVAEVRVLRVPSIAIFSFWLYFRSRKRSRIVPGYQARRNSRVGNPSKYTRKKAEPLLRDGNKRVGLRFAVVQQGNR